MAETQAKKYSMLGIKTGGSLEQSKGPDLK